MWLGLAFHGGAGGPVNWIQTQIAVVQLLWLESIHIQDVSKALRAGSEGDDAVKVGTTSCRGIRRKGLRLFIFMFIRPGHNFKLSSQMKS